MNTKPTKNTDRKAHAVPDLPLIPDQAAVVKGGKQGIDPASAKIYEAVCKGTHMPEVTIT